MNAFIHEETAMSVLLETQESLQKKSIKELVHLLNTSEGYPQTPAMPPSLPAVPTPAQLRAQADAVEQYEEKLLQYRSAQSEWNRAQSLVLEVWSGKLRERYRDISEPVFSVLFTRAYNDAHSGGYGEVEGALSTNVLFYRDLKKAELR